MDFKYKNSYSFKTLYPEIIGYTYDNVTYVGSVPYDIANTIANNMGLELVNIVEIINNISDTKYNINDLEFLLFRNSNDEQYIVAKEWIDPITLSESNAISLATLTMLGPTTEQLANLEKILKILNITNYKLDINTTS